MVFELGILAVLRCDTCDSACARSILGSNTTVDSACTSKYFGVQYYRYCLHFKYFGRLYSRYWFYSKYFGVEYSGYCLYLELLCGSILWNTVCTWSIQVQTVLLVLLSTSSISPFSTCNTFNTRSISGFHTARCSNTRSMSGFYTARYCGLEYYSEYFTRMLKYFGV